ncbi:hypothetical protein BDZ89DRAFT_1042559 [Hymenopellis radicata]|nr:hypothetical protein BDZ89DRAFT_1042559 [Hymenopellis radicata]
MAFQSIDATMDLKLAASTSTSDSPRFRLPLDKSNCLRNCLSRVNTKKSFVTPLVRDAVGHSVMQTQRCTLTAALFTSDGVHQQKKRPALTFNGNIWLRAGRTSRLALLLNSCTNTSTRHLSRRRQTLDLTADDDVNLALRRGCEIRLRLTVDRRNNSFGYVPVQDSLAACRLERWNITGDASVTGNTNRFLKI